MTGLFVAFEGGEGAGKSTQAALLANALRESGRDVVLTREPGSTAVGERLRSLLLDPAFAFDGRTEALLYAADRAQHVAEVIRPALDAGTVVITDRYIASSLAYQAAGRDLSTGDVAMLSRFATDGLLPDRTVLLDVDPTIGLTRAGRRGDLDRLEAEAVSFHERVRERFRELAEQSESWLVVAANASVDDAHRQILEWVLS